MDEGVGVGDRGAEGWAGVRLCNLATQRALNAERSVQARSGKELTGWESEREIIYSKLYKTQTIRPESSRFAANPFVRNIIARTDGPHFWHETRSV